MNSCAYTDNDCSQLGERESSLTGSTSQPFPAIGASPRRLRLTWSTTSSPSAGRLLKAFPALQAASPPTVRPCVCSAGARRWPWELDIYPPTEAWCSAACGDIRRGQELWRDAWIEADTSRWGGDAEDDLWGEYNPLRLGETEMEVLRCALARCRKKSGV